MVAVKQKLIGLLLAIFMALAITVTVTIVSKIMSSSEARFAAQLSRIDQLEGRIDGNREDLSKMHEELALVVAGKQCP